MHWHATIISFILTKEWLHNGLLLLVDYDAAIINKEEQLTQLLKVAWVYQAYIYPPLQQWVYPTGDIQACPPLRIWIAQKISLVLSLPVLLLINDWNFFFPGSPFTFPFQVIQGKIYQLFSLRTWFFFSLKILSWGLNISAEQIRIVMIISCAFHILCHWRRRISDAL